MISSNGGEDSSVIDLGIISITGSNGNNNNSSVCAQGNGPITRHVV